MKAYLNAAAIAKLLNVNRATVTHWVQMMAERLGAQVVPATVSLHEKASHL